MQPEDEAYHGEIARDRGRATCSTTGNGSLQMNLQELRTAVQHCLRIKLFVIGNEGYANIRAAQSRYFSRFMGEGRQVVADSKPDGTAVLKSLEDMFPYLDGKVYPEETRFLRESD